MSMTTFADEPPRRPSRRRQQKRSACASPAFPPLQLSSLFLVVVLLLVLHHNAVHAFPSNLAETTMGCMTELDPIEVVMNQNIIPYEQSSHPEIQVRRVVDDDGKSDTTSVVEYDDNENDQDTSPHSFQLHLENVIPELQYILEVQTILSSSSDEVPTSLATLEYGGCEDKQNRVSGRGRDGATHTLYIPRRQQQNDNLIKEVHVLAGWATGFSAVTLTDKLIFRPKQNQQQKETTKTKDDEKKDGGEDEKIIPPAEGSKKEEDDNNNNSENTVDDDEKLLKEAEKIAEALQHQQHVEEAGGKDDVDEEEQLQQLGLQLQDDEQEMESVVKEALREERKDEEDPMADIKTMEEFLARRMKGGHDNNAKEKAILVEERLHQKRQALLNQYEHTNPEKYRKIQQEIMKAHGGAEAYRRAGGHHHHHHHHPKHPREHMTLEELKDAAMNGAAAAAGRDGRRHNEEYEKRMRERRERMEAKMKLSKSGGSEDELRVPVPPQGATDGGEKTPRLGVDDDDEKDDDQDSDEKDDDDDDTVDATSPYPKHRHLYEMNHDLDLRQYFMGLAVFFLGMIGTIQMCLWTSRLDKGRRDL